MVVDTLGHLLALHVTPANEQDRAQVEELARQVQEVTGHNVQVAYVDAGYTGEEAAEAAECQERLYLVATQVGCGAQLCLGYSLPQVGTRLRTPA